MKKSDLIGTIVLLSFFAVLLLFKIPPVEKEPIKIGILHSLSGNMASSEKPLVQGLLLAVEEINSKGGLIGRQITPVVVDGQSDNSLFAREAERLITQEKVEAIFGCWTSACRKTLKPVVEKYNNLLFYALQYEGLETSSNIFYLGATPNQQVAPAIHWAMDNLGKNLFLVGSDYIFPHTVNILIKDQVRVLGGKVLGEEYIRLGDQNVKPLVEKIIAAQPDVIINTINGDTNKAFFKELRNAGITADKTPNIVFSLGEYEIREFGIENMVGHYASWSYFQSIKSEINQSFLNRFQSKYGKDSLVSDPVEKSYLAIHLWAKAVESVNSFEPQFLINVLASQKFDAPEGAVYVDSEKSHLWKKIRIGKAQSNGEFEIVWESRMPYRPEPFPIYRSQNEWRKYVSHFYELWGNRWENLG